MKPNPTVRFTVLCTTILISGHLFAETPPSLQEGQNPNEPSEIEQLGKTLGQFPRLIRRGPHVIPESSIEQPEDVGVRSHTNHLFLATADASSPQGETPQSIRQIYGLPASGGAGVIAIVDAFHYPTALNDFNVFAAAFGLPQETSANATAASNTVFQVVYASGNQPAPDGGWNQEAALDIEWAHAMAPNAKIVLVEAASNSNRDLNAAVDKANSLPGITEVSMSYGSSENRFEALGDSHFLKSGVVYFAASGDTGGIVNYPGCSPNVISAGGTTVNRTSGGSFVSETAWSGSGGGLSRFEARPSYQNGISTLVGAKRGVPDFSFDADPSSGVSVYDSTPYLGVSGWLVFGGTSVASPALAGIVNNAAAARGSFSASTSAELTAIYSHLGQPNFNTMFRDITQGRAGNNRAAVGWDATTGVGSSIGLTGK